MNFINLAHGAFAMAGGYVTVLLMQRAGWPFLACLPLAFMLTALRGGARALLYRPMYGKPHLDQVLFSIGWCSWRWRRSTHRSARSSRSSAARVAAGRFEIGGVGIGMISYRLFIVVCLVLTAILQLVLARTRFGSRLRAAVDDRASPPAWASTSTGVQRHLRGGLGPGRAGRRAGRRGAGPGSELPAEVHDLFPHRGAVGGTTPSPAAAGVLLLGIADVFGKYYAQAGAFIVSTR